MNLSIQIVGMVLSLSLSLDFYLSIGWSLVYFKSNRNSIIDDAPIKMKYMLEIDDEETRKICVRQLQSKPRCNTF